MKAKCLFGFCVTASMVMASPGDLSAQTVDDSGSKRKLELEKRNEAERLRKSWLGGRTETPTLFPDLPNFKPQSPGKRSFELPSVEDMTKSSLELERQASESKKQLEAMGKQLDQQLEARRKQFHFEIDPNAPLQSLLPTPPRTIAASGIGIPQKLLDVPEVEFQAPLPKGIRPDEASKQMAHQIAKINHLNHKKADGFMEALRDERVRDLGGLPFAMGEACRRQGKSSSMFARAAQAVHMALPSADMPRLLELTKRIFSVTAASASQAILAAMTGPPVESSPTRAKDFWTVYQRDGTFDALDGRSLEAGATARIAALMQILASESPEIRLGLIDYLAKLPQAEATQALARLAIFSSEDDVCKAAIHALVTRPKADYTDTLSQGLRYPLPAVARRSANTLAKLKRTDMFPRLIDCLEEPDPRMPVLKNLHEKKVPVVRELVRINHHRNCLLCHSPVDTDRVPRDMPVGEVPIPSLPLFPGGGGYAGRFPELLVRADVTYLREDFSVLLPVPDASPWPELQRYDFLVRERVLTEEEAASYRKKLATANPYHDSALVALRELSGRDAGPSPDAWRKLLAQPNPREKDQ
jgi:hypothetical protein